MSTKTIGFILAVLGVLVALISLTADITGLGSGNGIGPRQIAGMVLGVVLTILGTWLVLSKTKE